MKVNCSLDLGPDSVAVQLSVQCCKVLKVDRIFDEY